MSIFDEDFKSAVVVLNDGKYKISKIDVIDVSDQEKEPDKTLQITHEIEGFEVPIYLLIDNEEEYFTFGMSVGDGISLFVPVTDEEVFKKAVQLVASLEDEEN
ncbi:hypothetical protein CUC43_29495 [Bacillus thuringiensis LM1212]|uniref:hypothetical protein n=1 Tax=Bacillus cereus group TaxID=86661 RepID=UPI0004976315|nr:MULTISPECIES: hypothetical protein [Bacillus cereus group]AXY10941.1 hypothetical protein CUC43_00525 [Bacillus thuringiensis LM1212]AXY11163.1 hypothetical protein CUC43_29495 [Bacillus thuringiensis LM1212]QDF26959.1 hypothetical protein FJR70_10980 [Bacillus tropicus]QDF26973.1 hypothetical protein FJR70_13230 [Bacillus tropicus]QUG98974.1 hypothetical protein HCM98_18655 [Bacillus tropicus]